MLDKLEQVSFRRSEKSWTQVYQEFFLNKQEEERFLVYIISKEDLCNTNTYTHTSDLGRVARTGRIKTDIR